MGEAIKKDEDGNVLMLDDLMPKYYSVSVQNELKMYASPSPQYSYTLTVDGILLYKGDVLIRNFDSLAELPTEEDDYTDEASNDVTDTIAMAIDTLCRRPLEEIDYVEFFNDIISLLALARTAHLADSVKPIRNMRYSVLGVTAMCMMIATDYDVYEFNSYLLENAMKYDAFNSDTMVCIELLGGTDS